MKLKLKTYNSENTSINSIPTISININGVFRINEAAVNLLCIKHDSKISFHQDTEELEDWYLSIDAEKGFKFNKDNSRPNMYSRITPVYKLFSECFDCKSFKFRISDETIEEGGVIYFPIITKNNLINNKK